MLVSSAIGGRMRESLAFTCLNNSWRPCSDRFLSNFQRSKILLSPEYVDEVMKREGILNQGIEQETAERG